MQRSPIVRPRAKKSQPKHRTGGYYQFTYYDEEDSGSDEGTQQELSPKEIVDRILKETQLDSRPASGIDQVPEPDFTFEFHPEADVTHSDFGLSLQESRLYHSNRSSCEIVETGSNSEDDVVLRRGGPLEALDSPLDHPDSGYIDFIHSPAHSSSTIDHARSHSASSGVDNDSLNSFDFCDVPSNQTKQDSPSKQKAKSSSFSPVIRFTKFRSDFEKLEEDSYIDDEIHTRHIVQPKHGTRRQVGHEHAHSEKYTIHPGTRPRLHGEGQRKDGLFLPMEMDITLDEEEDIFDPQRGLAEEECEDTNPIIHVNQEVLAEKWKKRRRKIFIAISVLATMFGLAAFVAIAYIVYKFLRDT